MTYWYEDIFNARCPYEQDCKSFDTKDCNPSCYFMNHFSRQLRKSGIPRKFIEGDVILDDKDVDYNNKLRLKLYMDDVINLVEQGRGFYLFSESVGNGKTYWACKIGEKYIRDRVYYVAKNNKNLVTFINVPEFIELKKREISSNENSADILFDKARNSDLIILDEIGAGSHTDWSNQVVYDLINYLYINSKAVIVTSNLKPSDLADKMDARIVDRLKEIGPTLVFKGKSKRKSEGWW